MPWRRTEEVEDGWKTRVGSGQQHLRVLLSGQVAKQLQEITLPDGLDMVTDGLSALSLLGLIFLFKSTSP